MAPATRRSGNVVARYENGDAVDVIRRPGATTSGFTNPSNTVGPRELKSATTSSERNAVPLVSTAPTVMTAGSLAGERTLPYCTEPSSVRPVLPADVTTTKPRLTAFCTARFNGSDR